MGRVQSDEPFGLWSSPASAGDLCSLVALSSGGSGEAKPPARNERLEHRGWVGRLAVATYRLDKPVMAAVNGVVAGAGMSVGLACDMWFSSKRRTKDVRIFIWTVMT